MTEPVRPFQSAYVKNISTKNVYLEQLGEFFSMPDGHLQNVKVEINPSVSTKFH